MQQTSTPVANGSRVPVWPALLAFEILFTRPTTCAELRPSGLSITMMPFTKPYPSAIMEKQLESWSNEKK
jgi:hypothetical protein